MVSSDNIRGAATQDFLKSNKKLTKDQAFEKCRKQAVSEYNDELIRLIH